MGGYKQKISTFYKKDVEKRGYSLKIWGILGRNARS